MEEIAVLDFETTGLSPGHDRPTELAVAIVRDGRVIDRFQSLMNPGRWIPADVVHLTGITNDMVAAAPPVAQVMREAARFVADRPLVAHNASFDSKFWLDELTRAGHPPARPMAELFACTVLLSRRLYPEAPSHSLGRIVRHLQLPPAEKAHRALADAEMTAHLLLRMQADLRARWHIPDPAHTLLHSLQRTPARHLARVLAAESARQTQPDLPQVPAKSAVQWATSASPAAVAQPTDPLNAAAPHPLA